MCPAAVAVLPAFDTPQAVAETGAPLASARATAAAAAEFAGGAAVFAAYSKFPIAVLAAFAVLFWRVLGVSQPIPRQLSDRLAASPSPLPGRRRCKSPLPTFVVFVVVAAVAVLVVVLVASLKSQIAGHW